ncbi:MAG: hypothetical protein JWN44_2476 [Myxococcales bacterium]|nr:hypothetical protein [Myxococcales bacterium]
MASAERPPDGAARADAAARAAEDGARAPLLGTWRRWYIVVLATMAALVALFAALSYHYR